MIVRGVRYTHTCLFTQYTINTHVYTVNRVMTYVDCNIVNRF